MYRTTTTAANYPKLDLVALLQLCKEMGPPASPDIKIQTSVPGHRGVQGEWVSRYLG